MSSLSHFNHLRDSNDIVPFSFKNSGHFETIKSILGVKSKATGLDELPIAFIKKTLPVTVPYVTHFFNDVLMSSDYPDYFKQSKVYPVQKKGCLSRAQSL